MVLLKEPCCPGAINMAHLTASVWRLLLKDRTFISKQTNKSPCHTNYNPSPCSTRYHLTFLGHGWGRPNTDQAFLHWHPPGWTGNQGAEMFTAVWLLALYKQSKKKDINDNLRKTNKLHVTNWSLEVDRKYYNLKVSCSHFSIFLYSKLLKYFKYFYIKWEIQKPLKLLFFSFICLIISSNKPKI